MNKLFTLVAFITFCTLSHGSFQESKDSHTLAQFIKDVDISDLQDKSKNLPFKWRSASYDPEKGKLSIKFPNPSWKISKGEFDEDTGILTVHVRESNRGGMSLQVIKDAEYHVPEQYIGKVKKIVFGSTSGHQNLGRNEQEKLLPRGAGRNFGHRGNFH